MIFVFNSTVIGMHVHGLAHAAAGYHRVLEENRKLYNQVQDLKGKLKRFPQLHFVFSFDSYAMNLMS